MKFLVAFLMVSFAFLPFPSAGLAEEHAHAGHDHAAPASDYYQCSMHPWIVSDKPGKCPICGMPLVHVTETSNEGLINGRAAVQISPARQQLIGVTKDKAQIKPLVYSVHTVGHAAYNPDVATAFTEYREAYVAFRKSRVNTTEKIRDRAEKLMELAELKLRLAGLSDEQFKQIRDTSFDPKILASIYSPPTLELPQGHGWVDADLYESDSELVRPGQHVMMASPALPGKVFEGVVRTTDPILNEFPRKLRVRIDTDKGDALKAGMAVDMRIEVELGDKLVVPEEAVLDSGFSKVVFVGQGEDRIEPRQVMTGMEGDGYVEILDGLKEGETVVTSAAFLIDSESRLRAAAQGFTAGKTTEAAPASGHRHPQ